MTETRRRQLKRELRRLELTAGIIRKEMGEAPPETSASNTLLVEQLIRDRREIGRALGLEMPHADIHLDQMDAIVKLRHLQTHDAPIEAIENADRDSLHHQLQPTNDTCVQTCIAMVLNAASFEVTRRIGTEALDRDQTRDALKKFGVMTANVDRLWIGWHLVTVPSMYHYGRNHAVLVYVGTHGQLRVLDPSPNRAYKEDGSDLVCWSEPMLVYPNNLDGLQRFDSHTPYAETP